MKMFQWFGPVKQPAPIPIEGLSAESQAAILTGLKHQRQRLNSQIDQARYDAVTRRDSAIQHDSYAAADRRAQHTHEAEAKNLLEQHDAICRTISDMGGFE